MANELLTISDEAFIHLCIINYSATWKAQERQKRTKHIVEIPVSIAFTCFVMIVTKQITNKLLVGSLLGSQRPPTKQSKAVNQNTNFLPCGWSQEGLKTFNQLAKEISEDRKEHGEAFNMAFKTSIEEEMAMSDINKNGKRKRDCIDTYNDLNEGQLLIKDEDDSEEESAQWVRKNSFMV